MTALPPSDRQRGAESIQFILVESIVVTERLRPLRDDVIRILIDSMQQNGLINPITIYWPNGDAVPHLVSGAHRLEAARQLGWESIRYCELAGDLVDSADMRLLVEIDENLVRGDLSPAERAMHVGLRKEIYERLHPETKHGAAGNGRAKSSQFENSTPRFTVDTASKSGRSVQAVGRDATRAKHIKRISDCIGTSLDQGDELDALAKLTPKQQIPIIKQAAAGKKISAKLTAKTLAREAKEAALGTKQQAALPTDPRFGVIYADPPWRFEPWSRETGMDRSADNHYPCLDLDGIKAIPVPAADDCVMFLWTTVPMLPEALELMTAWGFTYKSHFIWTKNKAGTGYWNRNQHELLLVGTRGSIPAPAPGTQFPSLIDAAVGEHSAKPAVFAEMIEAMFPTLPKLEMFARRKRPDWEVWGNEIAP